MMVTSIDPANRNQVSWHTGPLMLLAGGRTLQIPKVAKGRPDTMSLFQKQSPTQGSNGGLVSSTCCHVRHPEFTHFRCSGISSTRVLPRSSHESTAESGSPKQLQPQAIIMSADTLPSFRTISPASLIMGDTEARLESIDVDDDGVRQRYLDRRSIHGPYLWACDFQLVPLPLALKTTLDTWLMVPETETEAGPEEKTKKLKDCNRHSSRIEKSETKTEAGPETVLRMRRSLTRGRQR
ncbi:hypothetical protein B0T09DRAFT_169939 [Sordaria sp. MPI-SDFR-AT-0083]|nr:hypothetical protein B0T09DRAFT_169939 [Sordaria sp. MPI-SDFR-AT-0083]